jgi:ABC-type glycerol-3-phosphate transport system substrate-binding protein
VRGESQFHYKEHGVLKLTLTLLLSLLLAACGGGDSAPSSGSATTGMVWDQGNFDEKSWQ